MEDGAICTGEVSGTLREGFGRNVSQVFRRSALLLCNPLGAEAWLLVSAVDSLELFFVTELLDDMTAYQGREDDLCLLGFVLPRRPSAVIPRLALRRSLFVHD